MESSKHSRRVGWIGVRQRRRSLVSSRPCGAPGRPASARSSSTFDATGLNHIALGVTDIRRSRDFYVQHLGLSVRHESAGSCFLNCGDHFVALFHSAEPKMDHYCYAVRDYDVDVAAAKLREQS